MNRICRYLLSRIRDARMEWNISVVVTKISILIVQYVVVYTHYFAQ